MEKNRNKPRVILISQWPNIKNAEYELIEKIRHTGFKIAVVDYLGFDVNTGQCINNTSLSEEYDFAISFHYDTPKFLNIPTFLWIANPLEYMHLRGDYRNMLIHHLRSYDDYLYNGSALLKNHIKRVVGSEWVDTDLEFYSSCSESVMLDPKIKKNSDQNSASSKIFYCGINWERGTDPSGRAHGLLDILQERDSADFYGPKLLDGFNTWKDFSSYRGEIPFDGISMSKIMQEYAAVLAVSSPAHIKSSTSSSRVFEGFTAGIPVISDENPHVRQLFGDLVYYFNGSTDEERAESIINALEDIRTYPDNAAQRVLQAQKKIAEYYSFEECLMRIHSTTSAPCTALPVKTLPSSKKESLKGVTVDVFLFYHDPYNPEQDAGQQLCPFHNITHIVKAASVAIEQCNAQIRFFFLASEKEISVFASKLISPNIEWISLSENQVKSSDWHLLRLGEKISRLSKSSTGDLAVFLTQSDYLQYDYFVKPLNLLYGKDSLQHNCLFITGFFVNDLSATAPRSSAGILRNNSSVGLYRWSQNSIAEHQLGQFCFSRQIMALLNFENIAHFDVLLPVAIMSVAMTKNIPLYRARHLLLRTETGYFHRHYNAYYSAATKGFWAQHYELTSNYSHELNALYDTFNEFADIIAIVDQITGHALPTVPPMDPALQALHTLVRRVKPITRFYRKVRHQFRFFGS